MSLADATSTWKHLLRAALVAALVALASACGGVEADSDDASTDAQFDDIANTPQSVVKRQSIGNCWIYATAGWVESLNLAAGGSALNASESYWTYFHWFEQLVDGEVSSEIETGGGFDVSKQLIARYGVIAEGDFVPGEASSEMSYRQKSALDAINASIKTGALKTAAARRDRALVRAELDKAWRLDAGVVALLDKLYGKDVKRHLGSKTSSGAYAVSTTGTPVKRATAVKAKYSPGPGKAPVVRTLAKAIVEWREVSFWGASYGSGRREFEKRMQRALHQNQPIILSWFVDFNALDAQGRFLAPPSTPGHQGGHMTVVHDYQIDNVPGFGTLQAGVNETRPEALAAALDDKAVVSFFRVKNSWGVARDDRAFSKPGYHDLYMKYLYGPVKRCAEGSTSNCFDYTPLNAVVFPPGY